MSEVPLYRSRGGLISLEAGSQGYLAHKEARPARTLEYKGTSIVRKCTPLEPYGRPMPRILWGS